jgi:capsular polysaccharide biosynthesis protein
MNIAAFCLPHGLSGNMNNDCKEDHKRKLMKGEKIDFSDRNIFDHLIVQSEYYKQMMVFFGVDPDKCRIWGSARFCGEWVKKNLSLLEDFLPSGDQKGRVKVAFMVNHWGYGTGRDEALDLIYTLGSSQDIYLVIKNHTRKTGSVPKEDRKKLEKCENIEIIDDINSPSLIKWADIVVNYCSSIGIEALVQGKTLLEPQYLHDNHDIYQETGAAILTDTKEETLKFIEEYKRFPDKEYISSESKNMLYEMVVFGEGTGDVLSTYYSNMTSLSG